MVLDLTSTVRSSNQPRCFWYPSCPPVLVLHRSPLHIISQFHT